MELQKKVWVGGCGLKQNLGGIRPIAPEVLVVPDFIWSFKLYEMLFRLRSELFSSVISTALAYPMSGVCNTTKRERNGNQ
jgi:hypothetical protein